MNSGRVEHKVEHRRVVDLHHLLAPASKGQQRQEVSTDRETWSCPLRAQRLAPDSRPVRPDDSKLAQVSRLGCLWLNGGCGGLGLGMG